MRGKQVWFGSQSRLSRSETEMVYHVMNPVGMLSDPDEIISSVVSALQADFKAQVAAILKLDGISSSSLELVKAIDVAGPSRFLSKVLSGKVDIEWGFLPLMIADFQPRAFDFSAFPESPTAGYLLGQCGLKGAICVPIILDGVMKGFYALCFDQVPDFSEQEAPSFTLIGGVIATVMEYCDLLERFAASERAVSSIRRKSEDIKAHAKALSVLLEEVSAVSASPVKDSSNTIERPSGSVYPFADLTQGELNTLALVAAGFSNGEIANRLFISEGTVKKRIGNIMMKLNLKNRTQLGVYFARYAR